MLSHPGQFYAQTVSNIWYLGIVTYKEPEDKIWQEVEALAGFPVYDLVESGGRVQVFLKGVDSDDCFKVCKKLVSHFRVNGKELGVGFEPSVEVSSPGLTRQLRRGEHFEEVVGKRVSVVKKTGEKITGILSEVSAGQLVVKTADEEFQLSIEDFKRANLEF